MNERATAKEHSLNMIVPSKSRQPWLEVTTVTMLGLASGLTPFVSRSLPESKWTVAALSFWEIAINTGVLLLINFYISRNKENWRRFGLKKFAVVFDPAAGLLVLMVVFVIVIFLLNVATSFWKVEQVASFIRAKSRFVYPPGTNERILSSTAIAYAAVVEEIAMRGFVLTRMAQISKSWFQAILATTLLSLNYHVAFGVGAALVSLIICFAFAVIFSFGHRIWPLVIAHAGIVVLVVLYYK
jgi:membrane protease YdiL (CAAX protease family)